MLIDGDLAAFLQSPVMIILGTSDGLLRPQIGRGVGATVISREDRVDVIVSNRQWPLTVANVRANGKLAVTFARPHDYVSYQVKGLASVQDASPLHFARARQYISAVSAELVGLGLEDRVAAQWFTDEEPLVLSLAVESIYVQTPGPQAGRTLDRQPS
jgi:hypothetical protein